MLRPRKEMAYWAEQVVMRESRYRTATRQDELRHLANKEAARHAPADRASVLVYSMHRTVQCITVSMP